MGVGVVGALAWEGSGKARLWDSFEAMDGWAECGKQGPMGADLPRTSFSKPPLSLSLTLRLKWSLCSGFHVRSRL
jgi:hypothetical protein